MRARQYLSNFFFFGGTRPFDSRLSSRPTQFSAISLSQDQSLRSLSQAQVEMCNRFFRASVSTRSSRWQVLYVHGWNSRRGHSTVVCYSQSRVIFKSKRRPIDVNLEQDRPATRIGTAIGTDGAGYSPTDDADLVNAAHVLRPAGVHDARVLEQHTSPEDPKSAHGPGLFRLASLWLCFFFAAPWPIGMALVNSNTARHTKRVTTSALLIIAAGLGSFTGPFFFRSDQKPHYILGFSMMFVCFAGEVACIAGLFLFAG